MPTFIKIGPLDKNLCGITSRGYLITRKEKTVFIKYGPINARLRKFYWGGRNLPTPVIKKFRTVERAKIYYKNRIKIVNSDDYRKLPPGKRILKWKDM